MDPLLFLFAVHPPLQVGRGRAWSALPDAPTIADPERFAAPVRRRLAAMGRAIADLPDTPRPALPAG
jgi:hypothetical protein